MGLPSFSSAAAPAMRQRVLFVSYAHADAQHVQSFRKHLSLTLAGLRDQRVADWNMFIDSGQLLPGQPWPDAINVALESAELMVFLVSVDSLNSAFCRDRELAIAAARGITIVPVLLAPCDWDLVPLPGHPGARLLSDLGALPKDAGFNLRDVSSWPSSDAAWHSVVQSLKPLLQRPPAAPAPLALRPGGAGAAPAPALRHVPPLLPYLCNQKDIAQRFNLALLARQQLQGRALVVILKGTRLDEPKQFWNRLRDEHLAKLAAAAGQTCLADADLDWPCVQDSLRAAHEVAAAVRLGLSRALTGNQFVVQTPEGLVQHLGGLGGLRPLVADFPRESARALKAAMHALLEFIESCPLQADLSRLVVVLLAIDAPELLRGELARSWKLGGYQRSQVVELAPLAELTPEDAADWHQDERIGELWQVPRQRVLEVFGSASRMRIGPFVDSVRPLLQGQP